MKRFLRNQLKFMFYLSFAFEFISCDFQAEPQVVNLNKPMEDMEFFETYEVKDRKWNILVYMSADNNLESAGIQDIYEMEVSKINTDEVSIFVLFDRSSSYDTSENNWSGTRLYKINSNRKLDQKSMISQEIECPLLGLVQGQNVELDLSSGYVLTNCLSYVMEKFPADDYGLIMWGHGTGWRNEGTSRKEDLISYESQNEEQSLIQKGFAFDDSSGTYMTLKQLGTALNNALAGRKLSFIGFDTCFGGQLEIMYELSDYAKCAVGSEGLVLANGWNYTDLFNTFRRCKEKTKEELCESVVEQFKKQYANTKRASIVAVNMENIQEYYDEFNTFSKIIADEICTKSTRNEVMGVLYSNVDCKTEKYTYGANNSDVYLDSFSMVSELKNYFGESFEENYENVKKIKEKTYIKSWSSDSLEGGLGVYFSTLLSTGILSTTIPSSYIKNKTYEQISFVVNSEGYVPTMNKNESLLDKLFYTQYN